MTAAAEQAVGAAMAALAEAVRPAGGAATAATEARVQRALDLVRGEPGRAETARRIEAAAVALRVMAEARRGGRPNLYASRLARLRRTLAS
jgi:hypothetical protein